MPRMPRAVLVNTPHHLTQRGLDRQQVFSCDADYDVYLGLVRSCAERSGVALLGYCLMPNHVHWVVAPREPDSLARAFGDAHGRYAAYANALRARSGHFWQNRFFSCSLDRAHLWTAMRYVERNPVRALISDSASAFRWSSAAAHLGAISPPVWLESEPMRSTFTPEQWAIYLAADTFGEAEIDVRQNTHTGRPSGSPDFVEWAESSLGRRLSPQKGGRSSKSAAAVAASPGFV
jgi:putative transposase